MELPNRLEFEADMELFGCLADTGLKRHSPFARGSYWELGFGPVGGVHPVWGLYRFDRSGDCAVERRLLWRSCPSEAELFRWCSRIIGVDLSASLLETVGAFEAFYERYFAARPHLSRRGFGTPPTVHAPTALQLLEPDQRYGLGA